MSDRPKGKMVYSSPANPTAEKAKQHQRQLQEEAATRATERREERYRTMPNRICYAELYEQWKANGGGKLPTCKKCRATIHWEEHHDCPGFKPRYRTDGLSRDERMEQRKAGWDDWDDDQYDETTPDETTQNLRMQHEAETGETYDQVVIEGMTEEEYLMKKFGYIPSFEDFQE